MYVISQRGCVTRDAGEPVLQCMHAYVSVYLKLLRRKSIFLNSIYYSLLTKLNLIELIDLAYSLCNSMLIA